MEEEEERDSEILGNGNHGKISRRRNGSMERTLGDGAGKFVRNEIRTGGLGDGGTIHQTVRLSSMQRANSFDGSLAGSLTCSIFHAVALCVQFSPIPRFQASIAHGLQSYLSTWNLMKRNNMG
jgi:hypothetical protein